MKAVIVREHGGPEVLRFEETPVPKPGPGEALVRVEAAGVNFIDIYYRKGLYSTALPFTPGAEAAGVVEEVGPGVDAVQPGMRVAWAMGLGAYAEYALHSADRLVPVPDGVSPKQAAAALLQGMTAHYLVRSTYKLREGDRCLVHAAAGGVGLLLVQIAKKQGATVYGTVSTEEKAKLAREAGADHVILYSEEDFAGRVRELTGGEGVDVVYDSVGAATFDRSLDCLRPRGTLVLFGQSSGPVPPVDLQVLNAKGSLYVTRPSLSHYTLTRAELLERAADLFAWLADGSLKLRIDTELPLAEAATAHRLLEGRKTAGKVLLIP